MSAVSSERASCPSAALTFCTSDRSATIEPTPMAMQMKKNNSRRHDARISRQGRLITNVISPPHEDGEWGQNREWGVGNREWGIRKLLLRLPTPDSPLPIPDSPLPTPHSPFPTPHFPSSCPPRCG